MYRFYRSLLRLCPSEFREEYGDEMARLFRDRCRREGLVRVVWEALPDLIIIAIKEHIDMLRQDVLYALRTWVKNPGYVSVALLTVMLVIAANTTVFSVLNAVLFQPLPYRDPDRLVQIHEKRPQQGRVRNAVSPPDFLDWKQANSTFEGMVASTGSAFNLESEGSAELIRSRRISPDYFRFLGIRPQLGRDFLPEDAEQGKNRVVLLSHELWQRHFGADASIIGRSIRLSGVNFTVAGVLPHISAMGSDDPEMWSPLVLGTELEARSNHYLTVYGRLKPGVSLAQARSEMDTIAARLEQEYPEANTGHGVNMFPLQEEITGSVRPALLVLFGAIGLVLLIACANIANLSLARTWQRSREISIRTALGAGAVRVVRQLLTESILLSVLGGSAGLLLAYWMVRALGGTELAIPRLQGAQIDWRVLLFTLAISLGTGLVCGLAPALYALKTKLSDSLKTASRGSADQVGHNQTRRVLIVAEIGLALLLSVGAGLLMRSFVALAAVNPGFDSSNLLTARVNLMGPKYRDERVRRVFFQDYLQRLRAIPGAVSVGGTSALPLTGTDQGYSFHIEGRPPVTRSQMPIGRHRVVSPGYFETMRIPLRSGRLLNEHDTGTAPAVLLISETMERTYWPDGKALGQRITFDSGDQGWREIVGVVADVKHYALDGETRPELYLPYTQREVDSMDIVMRTQSEPEKLAGAMRSELAKMDNGQPLVRVTTMEGLLLRSMAQPQLYSRLLAGFSGVALLLAAIGIYGVMSVAVGQKTREIGVRMALGATGGAVRSMVLREGMLLTAAGLVVGIGGAWAVTGVLSKLLFGVSPTDPLAFIGASVLLTGVALAACYLPARRATRVDPLTALRCE